MAKRGKSKPRKSKPKNNSPISANSRKKLSKELKNARARIRGLMNTLGPSYTGPNIEDFYLNNVLNLIKNGTHINTIYAMAKNATAKKIRATMARATSSNPVVAELYGGAPVTQKEYSALMKTLAKANRNIAKARNKFAGMESIMPNDLTADDVLRRVTTPKRLEELRKQIDKSFTPKNLVPTAINEDGEAGTRAELDFLNFFIKSENERRAEAREDLKNSFDKKGYMLTEQEFDAQPIDTSNWSTLEQWRNRTEYFTDAHDLDNANNWLTNYITTLDRLIANARINAVKDKEFYANADAIFNMLMGLGTPDDIRRATRFSPHIGIQQNYISDDLELFSIIENLRQDWEDFFSLTEPEEPDEKRKKARK